MAGVEACIVEYGLAGTTLERIAEKSGLSRPLVRHHVGNRDDILSAAIDRSFQSYIDTVREFEKLPGQERLSAWLDVSVYPGGFPREAMVIFNELIAYAHHNEGVRERIQHGYEYLLSFLTGALTEMFPDADEQRVYETAIGIAHIGDQAERWASLGVEEHRAAARTAAESLLRNLSADEQTD
jgi:AcrR family transcriptional regulator